MAKQKSIYRCQQCAATHSKWMGQCADCGAWNSLTEEKQAPVAMRPSLSGGSGYAGVNSQQIVTLGSVSDAETVIFPSGINEFDRVLGQGVVKGSVVLIGGDPGIGKSTLLLQTLANLTKSKKTLYISGEESPQQVRLRGSRLGKTLDDFAFLSETEIEKILGELHAFAPDVVVVDSIQTIYTSSLTAAPGSVSQIRESAAAMVRYAKQSGCTVFVVGHVTKEGAIAGPRVLEHMVDTVLYFEGEAGSRFRLLRVVKNRFGAVNELGVFAMTETGLKEVSNPSAIFLTGREENVAGSTIFVTWEGSRAILVEIQALVGDSVSTPRRVTLGLEQNRLTMLLAVLARHGGLFMNDQDVYANVVGGVKISETASDLAMLLACVSSFKNQPININTVIFGEIGLAGEVRPVPNGEDRVHAAQKHGFTRAIVPKANHPKKNMKGIEVIAVSNLAEALAAVFS